MKRFFDDRGFFMEVMRKDLEELFESDELVQANVSVTFPGIVRAWHRHIRGQNDYFVLLQGVARICAYDDEDGSPTRGKLFEIHVHAQEPRIVRIPGKYWHGFMALGDERAMMLYFVTRLYNAKNPDEERRPWNDPTILDPRTGKPYDWFRPPHR